MRKGLDAEDRMEFKKATEAAKILGIVEIAEETLPLDTIARGC